MANEKPGVEHDYYANDPHNPARRSSLQRSDTSASTTKNNPIIDTQRDQQQRHHDQARRTSSPSTHQSVAPPLASLQPDLIPPIIQSPAKEEYPYAMHADDEKDDESNGSSTRDDGESNEPQSGSRSKKKVEAVSYWQLYRFASGKDWVYVGLGIICSLVLGVGQPMVALLFGSIIANLTDGNGDKSDEVIHTVTLFTIVGAVMFVAAYGQQCFWTLSAEHQSKRIREKYLHAILRQDMSWHDTGRQSESLTTRLTSDTQLIFDGLADKVGLSLSNFTTFIAGFVIGFAKGWKLSLVLLAAVPLIGVTAAFMAKYTVESASEGQGSYSKAGAVAEQAISSIRTVVAFGGQKRETAAYIRWLDEAYKAGSRKAITAGLGNGFFLFVLFCTYGLAFWYGANRVAAGEMTSEQVLNVFLGMIIGAFALGNIGPNLSAFANARGAAYNIFKTIDRIPIIDSANPGGAKPSNIQGHIVVRDVDFHYPSRPDVPILKKMNVEVLPGQTIALVGQSGSGKSTIVGLVERFYDPIAGSVTLDGIEIKDYNVTFLRDSIGIVSQEPVLFNASIKENIALGIRKDQAQPTDHEIEEACRRSNAHDFISKLPDKYDTMVGEKGALLSGGQKQRIAIARALIKNPRILLLDEATSALDTESERTVQAALDKASAGRSTIVVAHRLSTIMNADVIYVMEKGVVIESGTHKSLLEKGGAYTELVAKQQLKSEGADNDDQAAQIDIDEVPTALSSKAPEMIRRKSSKMLMRALSKRSSIMSRNRVDSSVAFDDDAEDEAMERKPAQEQGVLIFRVLKIMKPEIPMAVFGGVMSAIDGA
ncbi:Multidrug resistance protein 1, partial [Mortierella antarctica]